MKTMIRMEVKDFQKALKALGAVVPTKSALPILQSVMLSYDRDRTLFTLQASDSENWLSIDCVSGGDEPKAWAILIEDDKKDPLQPICIRYDKLSAAIQALPSELTMLMYVEKKGEQVKMRVDYQTGEFVLPCELANEQFPATPVITLPETAQPGSTTQPLCAFSIDAKWLISRMTSARAALLTGSGAELRPVMGCECMDVDHEGMNIIGTDGHQLYKDRYQVGMGAGFLQMFAKDDKGATLQHTQLLIPRKAVNTVVKTFQPEGDIAIAADSRLVRMAAQGCVLTLVTLESKYPAYNSVIPQNQHHLLLDVDNLKAILQRIRLFTDDASELIRLQRNGEFLVISGEDVANDCRAEERIKIQNADDTTLPDRFAIGVKQSTLREMISCIETDNLIVKLSAADRPITIFEESKQSQLLILVMPMLLDQKTL